MAKRLDHILVIDVESTCWEGAPPPGQISEIIEIGVCLVDVTSLERLEKRSILVKPEKSEISDYCTALTTLTPEMLTSANRFKEAVLILKAAYHSKERLWASWGDYDRHQCERNCREYGLEYPFGTRHLNVKTLFAIAFGLHHEIGLDEAYKTLGMKMQGTHHRGDDDAWNIAGILCFLLRQMRSSKEQVAG
jgi:inhibitor of KinA sporulation pathway (predicted exonuclease)